MKKFYLIVLKAVKRLSPNGYGVSVMDEIAGEIGTSPSYGDVHVSLDDPRAKGMPLGADLR